MTTSESSPLPWPQENAKKLWPEADFRATGSNIVLDFHGDPIAARLTVFSDGNHHMALEESLSLFLERNPDASDVFYATTPPRVLLDALANGGLRIGNLLLSVAPDVFIGPGEVLDQLVARGDMGSHVPFAQSRGNVLLIRRGNPKNIVGLADLLRSDVRLALSNPDTESASHQVYRETILGLASAEGQDSRRYRQRLNEGAFVTSALIHHREIPQLLADDHADVAVIYFHLALRYARIFEDLFEIVPLSALSGDGGYMAANRVTRYHIGLIGDGGAFGPALLEFMTGPDVAEIYDRHGLAAPDG